MSSKNFNTFMLKQSKVNVKELCSKTLQMLDIDEKVKFKGVQKKVTVNIAQIFSSK